MARISTNHISNADQVKEQTLLTKQGVVDGTGYVGNGKYRDDKH